MRYFLNVNASRPVIAGGLTFVFEPVQNRGGSWLGVLSVEDSAASTLAGALAEGVDEITADYFAILKKKQMEMQGASTVSPQGQRVPTGQALGPVALAEGSGAVRGPQTSNVRQDGPVDIIGVILGTTAASPPREPLLEAPSMKAQRRGTG